MRTLRMLVHIFKAFLLSVLWLNKQRVGSIQLSAPEEVTGARSGSLTVSCQYDLEFKDNPKYWCKGSIYELCRIVVRTPKRKSTNRTFIVDDNRAGVFNVTMSLLRKQDEDTYWCVISRSGRNVFKRVALRISDVGETTPSTTTESNSIQIIDKEQEENSWWMTLRWILFFAMLTCLASTHFIVWRIKTATNMRTVI
ncbi:CMRF35-like molecule 7 [Oryzias melastigma]|uniref:CMRF35-like molecule 7 n=1 Tax=Oryzias melastigma TaxID=30732 RepID=A0A3B3BC63_ORYME|nr:CMRF35-like molecule 7 [Oryzias melastigma]KAF6721216.1 CMRF35-like molecule 7 [Oryzias melastigma]